MAVVQSSLDNLQMELNTHDHKYLERAQEGIHRLNLLVSRLSEAARLENALQVAEFEDIDLGEMITKCVEGYRLVFPDTELKISIPEVPVIRAIAPDLFVQMMDKIVGNAVDFSLLDKPVEVSLSGNSTTVITITNYGSVLPEEMQGQLFNSMVSIREKQEDEPHLGLGLYIANHIAEFHGGVLSAENLVSEKGVRFSIYFS